MLMGIYLSLYLCTRVRVHVCARVVGSTCFQIHQRTGTVKLVVKILTHNYTDLVEEDYDLSVGKY